MKMKRQFKLFRLAGVVSVLIVTMLLSPQLAMASTYSVDPFDAVVNGLVVEASNTTTTAYGTADDSSILGGERDVYVQYTGGASGSVTARSVSEGGVFSHSQASNVRGRTTLTWDGNDNDATTLAPTGLGGVDLTAPTNDEFLLYLVSSDVNTQVRLRVYTNANYWSERIINITLNTTGQLVGIPFSSFVMGTGATGVADFTNVGAIELRINNAGLAVVDLDMIIDFFEAADSTSYRDFGDLPDTYGTTLASNGARHVVSTLFMGTAVDDEGDGIPSVTGNGDTNESGVTLSGAWQNGAGGGTIVVNVNNPFPACIAGWIDFNNNGSFGDLGDEIFYETDHLSTGLASNMIEVNPGNNTLTFDVPAGTFSGSGPNVVLYARFRIVRDVIADGLCIPRSQGGDEPDIAATGEYFNGEVEDYQWNFNPTAVELSSITANSKLPFIAGTTIGSGLLAIAGLVLLRRRRM